jgi:hypothetical protein
VRRNVSSQFSGEKKMDRKFTLRIISQFCYEHSSDNLIHRGFILNGDRYIFDFDHCSKKTGFQQYDTSQDAWYFGTWVNIKELSTVTYAEGDLTVKLLESKEAMKEELERMATFYGEAPPMCIGLDLENGVQTNFYDERPTIEGGNNEDR